MKEKEERRRRRKKKMSEFLESDFERLCRNIATGFRISSLDFFETTNYMEIWYKKKCIASESKFSPNRFKNLFLIAAFNLKILKSLSVGSEKVELEKFERTSIEEAMINLDLSLGNSV